MDQEFQSLKDVFNALWSEQNSSWVSDNGSLKPSPAAKESYKYLEGHAQFGNRVNATHLEKLLPSESSKQGGFKNLYMPLPPIAKAAEFVPLLWLGYDLSTTPIDFRVRISMLRGVGAGLECLPFRFERGDGRHLFYHAQLCNDDWHKSPAWLAATQPSFPLLARCPVTLMVALMLTLYGLDIASKLLVEHRVHRVEHYIRELSSWVSLTGASNAKSKTKMAKKKRHSTR